jgi:hypothetical protein
MSKLKDLISKYGKDKINTFTKYPSILTLHKLGDKGRLTPELTTDVSGETMYGTEKIDGTNTRIVCYGFDYLFGSRENILYYFEDLYFDPAQGIVDGLKSLEIEKIIPVTDDFTVIYGEFYGGKVRSNSKWYGQDKIGFRVFDVAVYSEEDLLILDKTLPEISRWRETETETGIIYGQNFITRDEIINLIPEFELVPLITTNFGQLGDYSHQNILQYLKTYIPITTVALSETAIKKTEGLVLRTDDRSKIVKIRFEDYERTLR